MKYIVMECHYSYAILLSEDGRFVKAANLHYEPGQEVYDIIEMKEISYQLINRRRNTCLAFAIAAIIFLLLALFHSLTSDKPDITMPNSSSDTTVTESYSEQDYHSDGESDYDDGESDYDDTDYD